MANIEIRPPDAVSREYENFIRNQLAIAAQQYPDQPEYLKKLEEWYRGEIFSGGFPTDVEHAAALAASPELLAPPTAFDLSISQQVRTPGMETPAGSLGRDIYGRPIFDIGFGDGPKVQDEYQGMNAVPPNTGTPIPTTGFPGQATAGPTYKYGIGMDFGLTDIVPGGWTDKEEQRLRLTDPFNKELQLGGKYYREINPASIAQFGLDPATGMLKNPGWTNPEELFLRNYDPKNPVFNPGGQYYRELPAWMLGDDGFPAPPVTGPRYQYQTGMDFGRPDIVPGGWTDPTEQALRINDPNNAALKLGGAYYREIDPRGISQFGLDPATGMLKDPGWTNPEEMYLRNYDSDNSAFNLGGAYYREPTRAQGQSPAPSASELNGFEVLTPIGGTSGGYDPGDMGDAITNQQHEYMGAARAAAAQEAAYQERVKAERAATDASIAANLAAGNANNPSSVFSNVNQPVVNLSGSNPTNLANQFAALQSTQYQSY